MDKKMTGIKIRKTNISFVVDPKGTARKCKVSHVYEGEEGKERLVKANITK